ncbi:unnamed protein product [Scytosiphon promiscuus]
MAGLKASSMTSNHPPLVSTIMQPTSKSDAMWSPLDVAILPLAMEFFIFGAGGEGGSGISSGGGDTDTDSVRPVVGASLSTPSPADVSSEAAPAVVHTGANNRLGKRQRGGRRAPGAGRTQQGSAKATKAKRETMSRYFCSVHADEQNATKAFREQSSLRTRICC